MTPTLIVPGPAEDWLPTAIVASPFIANVHEPKLCWVPVTTLPAVPSDEWVSEDRGGGYSEVVAEPRPLRAGDTVELAALEGWPHIPVPFATAKVGEVVAKQDRPSGPQEGDSPVIYEFGACVWLWRSPEDYQALPGDWSSAQYGVRLTNVEALSGHVDSAVTPEEAQALRVINERRDRLQGESRWDA